MRTIDFFIEPIDFEDYSIFLEHFDDINDILEHHETSMFSLVSTKRPIYLHPIFDNDTNRDLEPENYIYAQSQSYDSILKIKDILEYKGFFFKVHDLTMYECNPERFMSFYPDDLCTSVSIEDFIDIGLDLLSSDSDNTPILNEESKIHTDYLLSFNDIFDNPVEVFENLDDDSVIYYRKLSSKRMVEQFTIPIDYILRLYSDTNKGIPHFFNEHICTYSSVAKDLNSNDTLTYMSYPSSFWDEIVAVLKTAPSEISISKRIISKEE